MPPHIPKYISPKQAAEDRARRRAAIYWIVVAIPAIFLGVVAGLMAAHLPGYAETQAVAVLVGAACVSVLRLPLASVMIASLLCAKAGLAVAPLIVVAVVIAYLTTEALTAFVNSRTAAPAMSLGSSSRSDEAPTRTADQSRPQAARRHDD